MSYKKVPIGALVTLRQGFAINKKTDHYMAEEPTSLPLLRIGDMKDGSFSVFVKETIPDRFVAKESDIIYTRTGQVGLVFRRQHGVIHNNCFTVTTNNADTLRQSFLYYALQEKSFYDEAISRATGAAQPDLPHDAFNSIKIYLPSIDRQDDITRILDSFNDLIENNQKQIKLLEEAAQRQYKEWFIDLRFPGHQSTPIVNGFPERWIMGTLGQIAEFKRGKTITKAQVIPGVVPVVAGGLEPAYYHNTANTKAPVITVSGSGANAGFTKMYHIDVFASDCSFADSTTTSYLGYVFCVMQSAKEKLRTMQKGSAQPHVYAKDINALSVLIPDKHLLESFCKIVSQLYDRIGVLEAQNVRLAEARDCLLPKLMSGQLEV